MQRKHCKHAFCDLRHVILVGILATGHPNEVAFKVNFTIAFQPSLPCCRKAKENQRLKYVVGSKQDVPGTFYAV